MIIGYSILYINDDNDIIASRGEVYSSWDKTLENAIVKADEIKKLYGENISYISLFRADSKKICQENGKVIGYRFLYKKTNIDFGNIYIISVNDE